MDFGFVGKGVFIFLLKYSKKKRDTSKNDDNTLVQKVWDEDEWATA